MAESFPNLSKFAYENFASLKELAENGGPHAQYNLGVCYFLGLVVPVDKELAVAWFRKSAEAGLPEAQYRLGDCYYFGEGVGEPCNRIPYPYCPPRYGQIIKEHMQECGKWWTKSAEMGHVEAQYSLGSLLESLYYAGIDKSACSFFEKNHEQASIWYRKAADTGHKPSMMALANNISGGRGVKRDEVESIAYYMLSDWHGCHGLLNYYFTEPGLTRHRSELQSAHWRAETIGKEIMPPKPHGDPVDEVTAFPKGKNSWRLFRNWKSMDDIHSTMRSSLVSPHIREVDGHSLVESTDPLILEREKCVAQFEMARRLASGDGLPKDEVEAYAYCNICSVLLVEAKELLATLESRLSRQEIAAGQQRTKELQKGL